MQNRPSNAAPSVEASNAQRAHFSQQERQSSKGGSKHPLAAPPVGEDFVVKPDGRVYPVSTYEPGVDIYIVGEAA